MTIAPEFGVVVRAKTAIADGVVRIDLERDPPERSSAPAGDLVRSRLWGGHVAHSPAGASASPGGAG